MIEAKNWDEVSDIFKNYCLNCKNEFNLKDSRQLYCTRTCKRRAASVRHYKKGKGKGKCIRCSDDYTKTRYKQKYCSRQCASAARKIYLDIPSCLKDASRSLDKNLGYVRVYAPMHPEANTWGYVYEHRLIAEQMINRRLMPGEIVHHKNGKRWDNREVNLEVMDHRDHSCLRGQRKEDLSI